MRSNLTRHETRRNPSILKTCQNFLKRHFRLPTFSSSTSKRASVRGPKSVSSNKAKRRSHTMEELQARHRKEAKDLQGRITSKKKNATKKTRKGVNDECAELERSMKERHANELASLSNGTTDGNTATANSNTHPTSSNGDGDATKLIDPFVNDPELSALSRDLASSIATMNLHSTTSTSTTPIDTQNPTSSEPKRKGNRQKARLARRAAEQEAASASAALEAESLPNLRAQERKTLDEALATRGLVEHEVRSDGHCLYAAMADQLALAGVSADSYGGKAEGGEEGEAEGRGLPDYLALRKEVAEYVLRHGDDFVPFLDEEELGGGGIEGYARRIAETSEWGGQMEILACARRWRLVVNVLQGDGRVERIEGGGGSEGGGGKEGKECWLVYYKHSFGLGEHYNSLRKR